MPSGSRPDPNSPRREHRHHHRHAYTDSPTSRRRRPSDVEARAYDSPQSPTKRLQRQHGGPPIPSPPIRAGDRDPMMEHSNHAELSRKRSLIRPERNRINKDHPNYQYRKHAQNMPVYPSTTGNDPYIEADEEDTESSASTDFRIRTEPYGHRHQHSFPEKREVIIETRHGGQKLRRTISKKEARIIETEKKQLYHPNYDKPPSLWQSYCRIITVWAPNAILRCFGKVSKPQQRAWREKMGLLSIILLIMTFVGYLTFGFTQTVCAEGGGSRLRINKVTGGFMIFHGLAYDLSESRHPLARGVPENSNVLFDGDEKQGGRDGSFLFQNVNGACKGLITPTSESDIPTNDDGEMGWYFPCRPFNQDGSSPPNTTEPFYSGYSCHTSRRARDTFYDLDPYGEVYFTWEDIRNNSRNLMVWGGHVLDLDLIEWFNTSAVEYPSKFDDLSTDPSVRGKDVTALFASSSDKQIGQCLSEIIKVGSIDTDTVGCIASKVVLYVSLVFILSIVFAKFFLALAFEWVLSRRFAPPKLRDASAKKRRQRQIEEWSDDIYRPPPKFGESGSTALDRNGGATKRNSFFPTTSRFTSPYAIDRASNYRPPPTTMASQNSSARLLGSSNVYRNSNMSQGTLATPLDPGGMHSYSDSRGSLMLPPSSGTATDQRYSSVVGDSDGPGPAGFIHEAVVPQPPPEWQPFGYPLGHAICLVTAYSEGAASLRTTLDSVATTDYPNSHKLIMVICDGVIKGKGEAFSTPDICLGMVKDHAVLPDEVEAFSYVAVASGAKRHNMAKIYAGFYDYGEHSQVPIDKQQRVPMMVVVKCGTPDEEASGKPGNRGKRDSQVILMSFLQKVMFDERMTELEFEMFNGIWKITGISPDYYEVMLMVDADTKIYPDSLTHMVSAMVKDPEVMGLCGETKIANKSQSWVSRIQVFEYFNSHHLAKSFESVFGGVTCLPGCFCMYRIKTPKGDQNYWVPILANPDIVEHYSENVVDTLHKKNLLLLGEDRYLSTLMLKTFPKRKQIFVPHAVCKTTVPDRFSVLLSQRRRWINSTVHNLMELVLVRDLCGTFCFSMQFVVFIELVGTLVLPAAISFTLYLIAISLKAAIENTEAPVIPLILLALILGLPGFLIVITASSLTYVWWMILYLISLPVWNFVLPMYAYWKFDDFSWGDTRKTAGEKTKKAGIEYEGEFDSSKITMKRWGDFEQDRRMRAPKSSGGGSSGIGPGHGNNSGTRTASYTGTGGWAQHYPRSHPSRPSFEPYEDD